MPASNNPTDHHYSFSTELLALLIISSVICREQTNPADVLRPTGLALYLNDYCAIIKVALKAVRGLVLVRGASRTSVRYESAPDVAAAIRFIRLSGS